MAKEKNKPVPVRFDLKLLEVLKEEEKIETPQQALNFLSQFWENNRPAKADFADNLKEGPATGKAPGKAAKRAGAAGRDAAINEKDGVSSVLPAKEEKREAAAHPSGLSGIDLAIWKAEQKEKK